MMALTICAIHLVLLCAVTASANPYLPKAGERPTMLRVATSAVTGGFVHFYAGLDYGIFERYGLKCEHIYIRGSSPTLSALAGDQIQFTYGAADGSLPGLATGVDAKVVASAKRSILPAKAAPSLEESPKSSTTTASSII